MSFFNITTLLSALTTISPAVGTTFQWALVLYDAEPVTPFTSRSRILKTLEMVSTLELSTGKYLTYCHSNSTNIASFSCYAQESGYKYVF